MSWEQEKQAYVRSILALLYGYRMIRTFYRDRPEGWTLVSGLYSPLYVQLRPLASYPRVFGEVCKALARMLQEEAPDVNRLVGIAMAGIPIAAGVGLAGGIASGFTRKMENVKSPEAFRKVVESYGEHSLVEGELASGDRIALVDDLVTRFDSKLVALEQVKYELARRQVDQADCSTVLVVLDREQGGGQAAHDNAIRLLSLIPFKTAGLPLLRDFMHPTEWDVLSRYLDDPDSFQAPEVRGELQKLATGAK